MSFKPSQRQSARKKQSTGSNHAESKITAVDQVQLKQVFNKVIPVSINKRNDLLKLSTTGAIPAKYHTFYRGLIAESIDDRLPEPDLMEEQQLNWN